MLFLRDNCVFYYTFHTFIKHGSIKLKEISWIFKFRIVLQIWSQLIVLHRDLHGSKRLIHDLLFALVVWRNQVFFSKCDCSKVEWVIWEFSFFLYFCLQATSNHILLKKERKKSWLKWHFWLGFYAKACSPTPLFYTLYQTSI